MDDEPGGQVPFPHLDRMILVVAALAHLFALTGLLGSWSLYSSPWAAAVLFVVSAALPVCLVVVPRRHGGRLPGWAAGVVVTGVLGVSLAVSLLLPPGQRSSMGTWNWGAGAMTMLGVVAYVPTVRTLAFTLAHAGLAVAVQVLSGGGAWRIHIVLVSTLVPPLGAAEYLRFYADGLRRRARAVADRFDAEAERRELDDVGLADHRRLGGLREEMVPLLAHVAEGGALPLDDERSRAAQQLADRLRAALVAQRRALWLPVELGSAPVTVACSESAARAIGASDRAWLAALLDRLDTFGGWTAVRVVLHARPDGTVGALVTAEGGAAASAAADPELRALSDGMSAHVDVDGEFLTVDTDLRQRIEA